MNNNLKKLKIKSILADYGRECDVEFIGSLGWTIRLLVKGTVFASIHRTSQGRWLEWPVNHVGGYYNDLFAAVEDLAKHDCFWKTP